MKSPGFTWKSFVMTFVVVTAFYLLAWSWMSKRQTGKGPWRVDFRTNATGIPHLIIAQPALGISNVTVRFEGEQLSPTNTVGTVAFLQPRMNTPFGRVVYDDLMFQPGIVTVDGFGHVIELAPRNLGLNGKAVPWRSGATYSLSPTNKVSAEERKQWKGGYQ